MIEHIDYCLFWINDITFEMKYNGGEFFFKLDTEYSKNYTIDQIENITKQFRNDMTKEEIKQLIFNS